MVLTEATASCNCKLFYVGSLFTTDTGEGITSRVHSTHSSACATTGFSQSVFFVIFAFAGLLEREEGEEGKQLTLSINHDNLDKMDLDAELQKITEELGPMIESRRQQLQDSGILDELRAMNFPVDELKLDSPRAGASMSGATGDNM